MGRLKKMNNVRKAKLFIESKLARLYHLTIRWKMPFAIHDEALLRIALDDVPEKL